MKPRITAILLSAGQGLRMNTKIPKQFLLLQNYPVLYYSLYTLNHTNCIDQIIIVTRNDSIAQCKEIVTRYQFNKVTDYICGGATRQDSVYQGLLALQDDTQVVLVHDGARPFVDSKTIEAVAAAAKHCAVAAAVAVTDTIKQTDISGFVEKTLPRDLLWAVQTPQAMPVAVFLDAHKKAHLNRFMATDDIALAEYSNYPARLIKGNDDNIKITTPKDYLFAQQIALKWHQNNLS